MLPDLKNVLIVCPASLKINWQREWAKWSTLDLSFAIATAREWPKANVVAANFDILKKHEDVLRGTQWDLIIVDEAHYLRGRQTQRTLAVFGGKTKVTDERGVQKQVKIPPLYAKYRMALTGTPIPNRPIEGFGIFNWLDPQTWPSRWKYAERYCSAHSNGWGWDVNGASNLEELQERLRASIMVRRLKRDVLTELPQKRRQIIELPANGCSEAIAREQAVEAAHEELIEQLRAAVELATISDNEAEYAEAVDALRAAQQVAFTEMAAARRDTAYAKLPYVIQHVAQALESGDVDKVLVFGHHTVVTEGLAKGLEAYGSVLVTGGTTMAARQAVVDRFQTVPTCRAFVGNIQAAGVGLTLTKATLVVFAELDYVPGNITQAEDRAHRIGQNEHVLIQHIVLEGSIDARMAQVIVEKQEIQDKALDRETSGAHIVPEAVDSRLLHRGPAADEQARQLRIEVEREGIAVPRREALREQLRAQAASLTPERIEAIHAGLRRLSELCDGALALDGMGFNKADSYNGKKLAELPRLGEMQAAYGRLLCLKYARQLDPGLVELARGGPA